MAGNKMDIVYRIFLFLKQSMKDGVNIYEMMEKVDVFPKYLVFLQEHRSLRRDWKEPPSDNEMMEALRKIGDKFGSQLASSKQHHSGELMDESAAQKDPNFSLSEFARLVLILRDDEYAGAAFQALVKTLNRAKLDAGISKETFWGTIAKRFNDISLSVSFSFEGFVDDVDPPSPPLCKRSASVLKEHCRAACTEVTKDESNWKRSGQNDPDKFVDFLSSKNGELYASSKRSLIIFRACEMCTPRQDTTFLNMWTKSILQGGVEEGVTAKKRASEETADTNAKKQMRKGQKADVNEFLLALIPDQRTLMKGIYESLSEMNAQSHGTCGGSSRAGKCQSNSPCQGVVQCTPSPSQSEGADWMQEESEFAHVVSTQQALARAKEEAKSDPTFLALTKIRYERALRRFQTRWMEIGG